MPLRRCGGPGRIRRIINNLLNQCTQLGILHMRLDSIGPVNSQYCQDFVHWFTYAFNKKKFNSGSSRAQVGLILGNLLKLFCSSFYFKKNPTTMEEEALHDEEESDGLSKEPAFECNPEKSSLKVATIIAHLHWMVNQLIYNLCSILT